MQFTSLRMIEKGDFILVSDESIYEVVGNYRNIDSPLDYELQNIENKTDEMCIPEREVKRKMGKDWKRIDL